MPNVQSSSNNVQVSSKLETKTLWGIYWLNKENYSMGPIGKAINTNKATA